MSSKIEAKVVFEFVVALLEGYYENESEEVKTDHLIKIRGNDEFIDNSDFIVAFESEFWDANFVDKYGNILFDDTRGYYLNPDED